MSDQRGEVTRLVSEWSRGAPGAFDELIELVYDDLRRLAHRQLRANDRDGIVDTTVLVHEAYLKLARVGDGHWEGRAQFFAFCSKAMRRILIDFARRRLTSKRGGKAIRIPLREDLVSIDVDASDVVAIDEALQKLEERNQRMAQIVECRFFGGMSVPETAEALDTSTRTVEREWARARAYLQQALTAAPPAKGNHETG